MNRPKRTVWSNFRICLLTRIESVKRVIRNWSAHSSINAYLKSRPSISRVLSNAGWLILDKLLRLSLGVAIGAAIARHLGPDDYGLLNFAIALVSMLSAISTAGLQEILVREFIRRAGDSHVIVMSALLIRAVAGLLVLTGLSLSVHFLMPSESTKPILVIIISAGLIAQSIDVVEARYQAEGRFKVISALRSITFIAFSAIRVIALAYNAPLIVFAALTSLELLAVMFLIAARTAYDRLPLKFRNARVSECKALLNMGWPIMFRLLAIGIYMRIDQVMLGYLVNERAVGVYSAAVRVSEIWYFVPMAAFAAAVPRLTELYNLSLRAYEERLIEVTRVLTWGSIAVAVLLTSSSSIIVEVLYGSEFLDSARLLAILSWAGVPVSLGIAGSGWFVNTGLVRLGLLQALVGALIAISLNALLIPRLGVDGSAIAVVASYWISGVGLNLVHPKTWPLFRIQMRALLFK